PPNRRLLRIQIDAGAAHARNALNRLGHMSRAITARHPAHRKLRRGRTSAPAWRLAHGLDSRLCLHVTLLKITEYGPESTRQAAAPTLSQPSPHPLSRPFVEFFHTLVRYGRFPQM